MKATRKNKKWLKKEDKKIIELYGQFSKSTSTQQELCEFIASELNGRTWKAVENRFYALGLNKTGKKQAKPISVYETPKKKKEQDFTIHALILVIIVLMATILFMVK